MLQPVDIQPFLTPGEAPPTGGVEVEAQFDVVTISGQSGTLKSSVSMQLADLLGTELRSRGGEFREELRVETGEELVDKVPEGASRDAELDAQTRQDISDAQATGNPIIIEGRLAGILLADEQARLADRGDTIRSLAVLILSGSDAKRAHRISKRQSDDDPTDNDVAAKTERRQADDTHRWQDQYPDLLGSSDPFDPALQTPAGEAVYDVALLIDHWPDSGRTSSDPTREALVAKIVDELVERGLATVVNNQEEGA